MQDIKDALGLTVEPLDIRSNDPSPSAFSPTQLVLFLCYHYLLVHTYSLVYSEGGEGLDMLLGDGGVYVLLSLKNIVFNGQGKSYVICMVAHAHYLYAILC
ncbi:hypothetical protein EON65_58520 [archaeon]|nr:MAG: hypothetical protein EON65_58520 [archaeon]